MQYVSSVRLFFSLFSDGLFPGRIFHRKRIRVSWLYGFGTAGMALYDDTVCAVGYKRWMGLEKKCVADNGMAFGNAAGDFLFWMERQTKGAVELGDGCFF